MRTPISYYGGKQALLNEIVPLIPRHKNYVEPFCGGAAVFWAKHPSRSECINDFDGRVVNFWRTLQNNFGALQVEIQKTLHSREIHREAYRVWAHPNGETSLKKAWAFWYVTNGSFSRKPSLSWAYSKKKNNYSSEAHCIARRREEMIEKYYERLRFVHIENSDFEKVVNGWDCPETFFYFDPPYPQTDLGSYMNKEKATETFERLKKLLPRLKSKWLLSSYLTDDIKSTALRNNWNVKAVTKTVSVNSYRDNSKKKTEAFIMNYKIHPTLW